MSSKKFSVFLVVYFVIQIVILGGFYFGITRYTKKPEGTIYSWNSDKIIIKKYNENKEEETSVTVKGKQREKILGILEHAPEKKNYNDEKFNYKYKLNFGNGTSGYLDTKEKIFEPLDGFYELTEEECNTIESAFE